MELATLINDLVPDLVAGRPIQINIHGDVVCYQWLQEIRVDIVEGAYFSFNKENASDLVNPPGTLLSKIEGTPQDAIEIVGQVRTDEPHIADWIDYVNSGNPTQQFIIRVNTSDVTAIYRNSP